MHFYQYVKEWLRNPQCSVSCCVALLLPLIDMKGDIGDQVTGPNGLGKREIDVGQVDMPDFSSSTKAQDAGKNSSSAKCDSIDTKSECRSDSCHRGTQTKFSAVLMSDTVAGFRGEKERDKQETLVSSFQTSLIYITLSSTCSKC